MADYPIWLEIASKKKIGFIDVVTTVHRRISGSMQSLDNYEKRIKFLESSYEIRNYYLNKFNMESLRNEIKLNFLYHVISYYYLLYDRDKVQSIFLEAKRLRRNKLQLKFHVLYFGSKFKFFDFFLVRLIKKTITP